MAGAECGAIRSFARENHKRPVGTSEVHRGAAAFHAACRKHPRAKGPFEEERFLEGVKGIADTGFLVAFANRNDVHHTWALEVASRIVEPLLTCEAVLAETAFHLQNVGVVLDMIDEELIKLDFHAEEHLAVLAKFARAYANRSPDFADLCLIRMSEMHPRHSVVTVDREDFRVYRRNKREMIPLICPPE